MDMVQVQSSNLDSVGYDEKSKLLVIRFKDGNVYEYYDVPKEEFDGLMFAASKGKYAIANIYKRYKQRKTT
jgi:hypothetical protein